MHRNCMGCPLCPLLLNWAGDRSQKYELFARGGVTKGDKFPDCQIKWECHNLYFQIFVTPILKKMMALTDKIFWCIGIHI